MGKSLGTIAILLTIVFYSCDRNTSNQKTETDYESKTGNSFTNSDPSNITTEEPFKNQPNEFCTIIRKLEVELYAPEKKLDENISYPKKYCLLDVCLDHIDNDALIVDLGDSTQTANATYALIKVFETFEETKAYEIKYGIKDVVYEE